MTAADVADELERLAARFAANARSAACGVTEFAEGRASAFEASAETLTKRAAELRSVPSTHDCPGRCGRQVERHLYACRACWGRLPYQVRRPITANYQRDAAAHSAAMTAARAWFEAHLGVRT